MCNNLGRSLALFKRRKTTHREFGTFSSKIRPAKYGRNIREHILIAVPEQRIVVFKPAGKFGYFGKSVHAFRI
ncbi:HU family DNA-binding protein [Pedobacter sp. GSP4]|uniref:HU family DNA-binding protein n=1 Tax=Pedobacter sp. GSP4 TaxID=3453716 RepID=UPI003EECF2FE